jgi:hypothetical protein
MRGAPPVHLACGRDTPWRLWVRGLSAVTATTLAVWLGGALELPGAVTAMLAGGAGGSAWLVASPWAGPLSVRQLAWDGQRWTLQGLPGDVDVMFDLGAWVLLRFRASGTTRWLAVTLGRCGAPTTLCRAALMAHAGRPSGAGRLAR